MVCTFVERCPKLLSFSDQELVQVQHVHGHQALSREDTSGCLHGMALFAMKLELRAGDLLMRSHVIHKIWQDNRQ